MVQRFCPEQIPFLRRAAKAGCLFFSLLLSLSLEAQTLPPDPNAQRPRIGLVLSGGGARGAAHIGVLKVLEELRVPVDAIAGTSMGALVGGAYASGMTIVEMQRQVLRIRTADIVRDHPPRHDQPERLKRDDRNNFLGPEFGVKDGELSLPKGAVSGIGLEALLRGFVGSTGGTNFDTLPIPLRVIATNIETGQMHVLASGDLATALRASISIPGLLAPAEVDDLMLVDGGLTRNLPVDVVRQMGVDIVIAVNLGTPLLRRDQVTSVLGVTAQMINVLTEQNVQASLAELTQRDVLISPELGDFASSDFDHMADIVGVGEAAARALAPRLARLALSESDYAAVRDRQRRAADEPSMPIDEIRFTGLKRVSPSALQSGVHTQVGRPLDAAVLDADLQRIFGQGDFDHVGYHLLDDAGKRVVVIDVEEKASGPDYLRFGLGLSNDFAGNAHFQALASYRRTWLNARGAEWRTDVKLGRVNQLASEFFQPLKAGGSLFVAPSVDLEQKPFDVFDGRNRVARFSRQTGQLSVDAGLQSKWLGEARLGLYRGHRSYRLDTGPSSLASADEAINIGGARLRLSKDQLDSGRFPRNGYAASLDVLASRPALGARDGYTRWETDVVAAFSRGQHTLQLALHAGGALGNNALPAYDLFPFGGFMQLSGYRSGQLLGQSIEFGRVVYGRQISAGPLLEGLFAGFSLEAGRVRGPLLPSSPTGLLTAGSVFIATDTPIGPVYLGFGHARGGNNALYLYLGLP
jgi:NTE family protein